MEINETFKALIPPLSVEEFEQLKQNIILEGCRDSIVTWNGVIIDGHNRFKICTENNISFNTIEKEFKTESDVIEWIILNQFGRRNLSNYQRSVLALRLEDLFREKAKEKQRASGGAVVQKSAEPPIETRQELAKVANVSHDTIAKVKAIEAKAPEEVKVKLRTGEVSINQAYTDIKREEKKQEQTQRFEQLEQKASEPIVSNYDVIVIDPPWKMEKIQRDVAPMQIGFDYPTMDIEEIKNFKLPAAENCHVFMWITHKHLPFGFDIFKEWNVKYVCCFVWHKNGGFQPFGLPQYNCEFVIYGRIGTPEFFDLKDFNVCFNANRTGHSEKPDVFYSMIKRVTAGARIDIFSRRKIEGFDNFGNEAKNE